MPRSDSAVCSFLWPLQATQTLAVFPIPWFPLYTAVPNSSVPFTSMQYIALCGALYSTWVELSQTACCNFTLTGNDFFFKLSLLLLLLPSFWRLEIFKPKTHRNINVLLKCATVSKSMPLSTLVDLMGCEDCNGVNFMPRSLSASRANTHVYALKSVRCRQISTGNWKHTMPWVAAVLVGDEFLISFMKSCQLLLSDGREEWPHHRSHWCSCVRARCRRCLRTAQSTQTNTLDVRGAY